MALQKECLFYTMKKTFRRPSSHEASVYTGDKAVFEELAGATQRQPVPKPGWEEGAGPSNRAHLYTGMANQLTSQLHETQSFLRS